MFWGAEKLSGAAGTLQTGTENSVWCPRGLVTLLCESNKILPECVYKYQHLFFYLSLWCAIGQALINKKIKMVNSLGPPLYEKGPVAVLGHCWEHLLLTVECFFI